MEIDLEVQQEVNHMVVENFFEGQFLMTSNENTNSSNSLNKRHKGQKFARWETRFLQSFSSCFK